MEITKVPDNTTIQDDFGVKNSTKFCELLINSNISKPIAPKFSYSTSCIAYICFSFVCIFLALVSTLAITRKLKSCSKSYTKLIMSLAVLDTMTLMTAPITSLSFTQILRIYPEAVIYIVFKALYRTTSFCATLIVVLISIERFIAVWLPLKSRQLLTAKVTIISILSCAFGSVLAHVMPAIHVYYRNGADNCVKLLDPDRFSVPFLMLLIPASILLILTPLTIGKLLHTRAVRGRLTSQELNSCSFQTSVLLITVVVVYVLLSLVPSMVQMSTFVGIITINTDASFEVALALTQINHSTNFILYGLFNKEFREKVNAYLCFICSKPANTQCHWQTGSSP